MLTGKTAIVTGSSRGIGAACAVLLARNGAAVGINYVANQAAGQEVMDRIKAAGGKAHLVQADARDRQQVEAMITEVEKTLGPIDILVNNANISFPVKPFLEYAWEEIQSKLTGEIGASFNCCQTVLPGMIKRGHGRIINISSGLSVAPGDGFVAHSTAKSGLNAFTRALAHEFGPMGITVNTVSPGLTETDATSWLPQEAKAGAAAHMPLRRIGMPADIAGAVLFFASDHSGHITGAYLGVDGGATMVQ